MSRGFGNRATVRRGTIRAALGVALFLYVALPLRSGTGPVAHAQADSTPVNFTIAFIGDQGLGPNAQAVLDLIRSEGADAVVHSGDFDYLDNPQAWDEQINGILGRDFPYFASVGNHDVSAFEGPGGYQEFLVARMIRLGIPWNEELGIRSSFYYSGIFFVLTAPDVFDRDHAGYIQEELAADDSIWRISSWHKNMRLMQVGGKSDETGWGVYEESRRGGAIIATGHEHSYSRTHLLSNFENQTVASTNDTLILQRDDPDTTADEGRSFVFVSGIAGKSIRDQELDGPWWASVYTSTQGANYGALFGVFNYQGNPRLAHFYFKDIDDSVADEFFVESTLGTVLPSDLQQPISGRKLVIKNQLPDDESRNRIVFVSRDRNVSMAQVGSEDDPRCGFGNGGSIEFSSATSGQRFTASLPCANWDLLGTQISPRGYLYRDPQLHEGPCRLVTIAHRRLVRASCMGRGEHLLGYDLQEGEPQQPVQVEVTTGASVRYCSTFGGAIRHDGTNGKRFLAKNSLPLTDCP